LSVSGLKGGHSGVDIDKDIPNAIKVLAEYLKDRDVAVSSFSGGERRNSIPTKATATVSSKEILESSDLVEVEPVEDSLIVYDSRDFIDLLAEFKHGVELFNNRFNLPDTSINLAIVNLEDNSLSIEATARGMSDIGLENICNKNIELFKKYRFRVEEEYKYPAWRPQTNDFTDRVYRSVKKIFGESKYKAIHAGLECGVVSEKYPNINFASIGPTIKYPHSIYEMVKIDSIEKTFKVILDLIENE
jgi:dipeptidase D